MAAPKSKEKEIDYVSMQANLTAQIERERLAAKRWLPEYGMCYLDDANSDNFSYENRIKELKNKLKTEKFAKAELHTTSHDYGCRPPFNECMKKRL